MAQRSAPKEEEQEESFDYNLNPDDLAEGKHFLSLKKENNELKKLVAEKELTIKVKDSLLKKNMLQRPKK